MNRKQGVNQAGVEPGRTIELRRIYAGSTVDLRSNSINDSFPIEKEFEPDQRV